MSVANHVAHHAELGEEPRISTKSAANQIEEVSDQVSVRTEADKYEEKTSCCLLPFPRLFSSKNPVQICLSIHSAECFSNLFFF